MKFSGQVAALTPHLENGDKELSFAHRLGLPGNDTHPLADAKFFTGKPPLVLVGNEFFLVRNAPPTSVLEYWSKQEVKNLYKELVVVVAVIP